MVLQSLGERDDGATIQDRRQGGTEATLGVKTSVIRLLKKRVVRDNR